MRCLVRLLLGLSASILVASPSLAFMPLHMLDVRQADLPGGYVQQQGLSCTRYRSASDLAREYNLSAAQLHQHGWANAYGACYQDGARRQVYTEIEEFASRRGAKWFYDVNTSTMLCCGATYWRASGLSVGATRTWFIATQGANAYGVVFQRDAYVVELDTSPAMRTQVMRLARLVDSRIERYG